MAVGKPIYTIHSYSLHNVVRKTGEIKREARALTD
jgi:hypothetical protein